MFPVKVHSPLCFGYGYGVGIFYQNHLLYFPALLRVAGVSLELTLASQNTLPHIASPKCRPVLRLPFLWPHFPIRALPIFFLWPECPFKFPPCLPKELEEYRSNGRGRMAKARGMDAFSEKEVRRRKTADQLLHWTDKAVAKGKRMVRGKR